MAKLAFSNIGWAREDDETVLSALKALGYSGLEIAPPRFIGENPYARAKEAAAQSERIKAEYGLEVCSMQSLWTGRGERIAESDSNRAALLELSRMAFDFSKALGCENLVFGCPKNRAVNSKADEETNEAFLRELAEMAAERGEVLALEANPDIYGTNYLNHTRDAVALARRLGHGAGVNLDFGTIIQNGEDPHDAAGWLDVINHVHISEPYLAEILHRPEHRELARVLREGGYKGYVSVEMKCQSAERVIAAAQWLREVFA